MVDVHELLTTHDFRPDIIIQTEVLHDRTFVVNLDKVDAIKVFWALDTHLNIHWHKYYTRLFDAVFTPHLSFYGLMPETWTPKQLFRLAKEGVDLPFIPHVNRGKKMAFVGRDIPQTRPLRSRFLKLMRSQGVHINEDLSPSEMIAFYLDSCIVPNESIAHEVNFRLMEAASAGACVLSPDVGEDQDSLFEKGREVMVYENGLDLLEKTAFLRSHPEAVEKIGKAAWGRVQMSHLPAMRAEQLLAAVKGITPAAANETDLVLAMTQRGRLVRQKPPANLLAVLKQPEYPEAFAQYLRLHSEFFPSETTDALFRGCAQMPHLLRHPDIAFTTMAHALHKADLPLFSSFWILWHANNEEHKPHPASSLYEATLQFAELLQKHQRNFQPGFRYDPSIMLPETALEVLRLAQRYAGQDGEWARRTAKLTSKTPALLQIRQNVMNTVVANEPTWRNRVDYACTCIEAYDNELGLVELQQARTEAEVCGKLPLFESIVHARRILIPGDAGILPPMNGLS